VLILFWPWPRGYHYVIIILGCGSLFQAYGTAFLQRVLHKHTLAKNHFFHLPAVTEHLGLQVEAAAARSMSANTSGASSAPARSLSGGGQSRRAVPQSSA